MAMPLILVGSLFLILISWPQEDFTNWLNSVGLLSILTTMNQSTVAIISLVACFGIAYRLSEGYGTDGPSAGIIALSSFVLMAPRFRVWFMIKWGAGQAVIWRRNTIF